MQEEGGWILKHLNLNSDGAVVHVKKKKPGSFDRV